MWLLSWIAWGFVAIGALSLATLGVLIGVMWWTGDDLVIGEDDWED